MEAWLNKYCIAKEYRREYGDLLVPDKFHYHGINLGNWIYLQRKSFKDKKLSAEKINMLNEIGMVWCALPDYALMWEKNYKIACRIKEEFNTLMVPTSFVYDGRKIGKWISHQRESYKAGKLSAEQVAKLNSIGMVWDASNNNIATSFPEQALFYYVKQHFNDAVNRYKDLGFELDVFIPSINTAIEYDGFLWHKDDAKDKKKNSKCSKAGIRLIRIREEGLSLLNDDGAVVFRINRGYSNLREVVLRVLKYLGIKDGVVINLEKDRSEIIKNYVNVYNDHWNRMYGIAKEYYEKHHSLININDEYLDGWVKRQRDKYAGHKTPLSSEQIKKLEAIGMKWDVYGDQWLDTYKLAVDYYNEHGDLNIKNTCVYKGVNLGAWISSQRTCYKAGILSADRTKKLEKLNMIWDASLDTEKIWNDYYVVAKEYYAEHGNLDINIRASYKGVKLGPWINKMRTERNKLSPERIKKLEHLGIVWDVFRKRWFDNYAVLEKYYKKHNNILVPFEYRDGEYRLGEWLHRQMSNKDHLDIEQIELLEKLGIVWERNHSKWDDMFELAKRYYEEHGDLMINTHSRYGGKFLGRWINKQRVDYQNLGNEKANANFSLDRIKKLETIGMVWNVSDYLWEKNYGLLKEYCDKTKKTTIPSSLEYKGVKLGSWLSMQRGRVLGWAKRRDLTDEQIERLNSLGIKW